MHNKRDEKAMIELCYNTLRQFFLSNTDVHDLYPYIDNKLQSFKCNEELCMHPSMMEERAVFITLYSGKVDDHNLRGCIGSLEPESGISLYKAIVKYTLLAAFADPRFAPLDKNELDNTKIEISILTDPVIVNSYKDIEFGKDGVIVVDKNHPYRRGVFLPEVSKHFPNLDLFLEELCAQKAGLPRDFYKTDDALISIFQTEKIS